MQPTEMVINLKTAKELTSKCPRSYSSAPTRWSNEPATRATIPSFADLCSKFRLEAALKAATCSENGSQ